MKSLFNDVWAASACLAGLSGPVGVFQTQLACKPLVIAFLRSVFF
jgi:hypothetical protein